jgi:hypothetical protein
MKIAPNGAADISGGRVASVVFRGNFIELAIAVSDHLVRAQVGSDALVKEGDRLDLALAPERIRVVG